LTSDRRHPPRTHASPLIAGERPARRPGTSDTLFRAAVRQRQLRFDVEARLADWRAVAQLEGEARP
jgi:hypothetical protein